jgi:anti-sigma regulatory factor (Ser/Thr protein kinase)
MLPDRHLPNFEGPTEEHWFVSPDEIARVYPWIERLGAQYAIPENVQFAVNLCLEEVLSNIFRHGYKQAGGAVLVHFVTPREGRFVFTVEDQAPHFNPLDQPELPPLNPEDEMRVGGQGLRFLKKFADELAYERLPAGNRIRMVFDAAGNHSPGKENC